MHLGEQIYLFVLRLRSAFYSILLTRLALMLILLFAAFAIFVVGYDLEYGVSFDLKTVIRDFYANVSSEILGIVLTVFLIDTFNALRHERDEKEALVLQLSSPNNAFAIEAVRVLWHKGWIRDGTLHHRNLHNANLEGANLTEFDLRGSYLIRANLKKAKLNATCFKGASLALANLENAQFAGTDLRGADLAEANLKGALFLECIFDFQTTILPDGKAMESYERLDQFIKPDQ